MTTSAAMKKFEGLISRLERKIRMSQTPVPGFILGISGTDSLVALYALYEACKRVDGTLAQRIVGVHYVDTADTNKQPISKFEQQAYPWIAATCSLASMLTAVPLGGNHDPQRWADLHLRSLNQLYPGGIVSPYTDVADTFWVSGTMNLTEKMLGKYSNVSTAVSIQPIQTLYKSEILEICEALNVPDYIIANARIPECICGRDEFAAENIELIDQILKFAVDPTEWEPEHLKKAMEYVRDQKRQNGFKDRIPYTI